MELKTLGLAVAAVALLGAAWLFVSYMPGTIMDGSAAITNFDECAAAGNPVMESYPRQCMANGQNFVEDISKQTSNNGTGISANGCAVSGCSGQLCVSADEADNIMTTCEYRPEYGCYREASCEPQANGGCGWTQTAGLMQCLANPPAAEPQTELQVI